METIQLTCGNPECPAPLWERPKQKGRAPTFCPPCKDAHLAARDAAKDAERPTGPEKLVCQNPECPKPNWERERARGAAPMHCPPCREARLAEKNTPKMVTLTCGNPACESPQWERVSTRGKAPKLCPTCSADPVEEEIVEEVVENPVYMAPVVKPVVVKGRPIWKAPESIMPDFANTICFTEIEKALQEIHVPQDQINDSNNSQEFLVRAIIECERSGVPKLGPTGLALVAKYEEWVKSLDIMNKLDPKTREELGELLQEFTAE